MESLGGYQSLGSQNKINGTEPGAALGVVAQEAAVENCVLVLV